MESFSIGSKALGLSTLAILVMETFGVLLISPLLSSPLLALVITRILQAGAVFAVLPVCNQTPAAIGLGRDQLLTGFRQGLLWSLAFGLCTLAGMAVLYMAGTDPLVLVKGSLPAGGNLVLFFVAGGLVAPVAEEIFFRGVVYAFLRRWGILAAIIGTTLIFVLLHGRRGLPITQAVGGILFCAAYEKERKLMTPITIHALGNTAIFALSAMVS
jgi:hypothetical protein